MTYLAVGLLVAASLLAFAYWVAVRFAEARELEERANAGVCHCTRHRICDVCLAELREPKSETERSQAA